MYLFEVMFNISSNNNKKGNNKKAYSLLEVVVSLGIIAIIIVIFFNALFLSLQITFKNLGRSLIREEISTISSFILQDLRNADVVSVCEGNSCNLSRNGEIIEWSVCEENKICRNIIIGEDQGVSYKTSNIFSLNSIQFEPGFVANSSDLRNNILLTISAAHTNPNLNINNVVRQLSISTRNYEL